MKPLLRACTISCVAMGLGDAVCQSLGSNDGKGLNWPQMWRFAFAGATLHGPYFYYGFRLIDRVPMMGVTTALGKSLTKTVVTQGSFGSERLLFLLTV